MTPPPTKGVGRTGLIVGIALAVLVAGAATVFILTNNTPSPTSSPKPNVTAAPPDQTYTVRGTIAQLPTPADPQIQIAHEAIPDFKDRDGNTIGMGAMVMPFTVAPDVDLTDFKNGDQVEFTLEVRWETSPRAQVSHLTHLPTQPG